MAAETPSNDAAAASANGDGKLARHWIAVRVLFYGSALALLAVFLWPALQGRHSGPRYECKNMLKRIGLALHNYHDVYGCLPPAYIADEDGNAMHSWRVLLLPYLDEAELFDRYRFDEPWNGPNNRILADAVPGGLEHPTFRCPNNRGPAKTMTNYVAVIGPHTAFPGKEPVRIAEMTDGPSDTIVIVEVVNSGIHWMEPRDLHVLQMSPRINSPTGQGISSVHEGGAQVLFANGHVRFLSQDFQLTTIRAMLTIDGGEEITALQE